MNRFALVVGIVASPMALGNASAWSDDPLVLRSPNGAVVVRVALAPAAEAGPTASWSLDFEGTPLLEGCALGLVDEWNGQLLDDFEVHATITRRHDEPAPILFGKAASARDRYREVALALHAAGGPLTIRLRCFDDAFAFRYELGEPTPLLGVLKLVEETTSFQPSGEWTAYVQYLEHHHTSHEHAIERVAASELAPQRLVDLPLTFERAGGPCFAITEAGLRHYAGLSLRRERANGPLVAALSPGPEGIKVVRTLPCVTPWRVVLVGARPGALLESNVLHCLNDPPSFDPSWVKPGKLTWPWWNGYLFDAERGAPILSFEASQRHIDFCAKHGIAFHAYVADEDDSPWYHQAKPGLFPGPETDATRVRDGLPLADVRRYADERGVGLWTWAHHGAVRGRVEEVFAALANHGFRGVMVDFLDRDDQGTVEFAEEVLAAAARHHVLVHFHGMPKPTGLSRTYPNLMNHEGALNLEYLKWSDRCTPEHTLRVVFTRMLAGPLDYHLGGFQAVPREQFVARNIGPSVLGTRCHHLALYVCIDNPAPMVADRPGAYVDQPGFELIRDVPTWWDETRVLAGEIGSLLVTARRHGAVWYVGGISAGAARDVTISLGFLGKEPHDAELWRDVEGDDPNALVRTTRPVTSRSPFVVHVARDGGFVARIRPRPREVEAR